MRTQVFMRFLGCLGVIVLGAAGARANTQHVPLLPGWNFVSFQLEPVDPNIGVVLSGTSVTSVWHYDAVRALNEMDPWLQYRPADPDFLNTLEKLHARMGYWIRVESSTTLTIEGQVPPGAVTLYPGPPIPELAEPNFYEGWNPVGVFSPSASYTVQQLLNHPGVDPDAIVWSYDTASDSYVSLVPTNRLDPGRAYWIETKEGFDFAPDIEVSPLVLNFGAQGETGLFHIRNRGSDTMAWQAVARTDDGMGWLGLKEQPDTAGAPSAQLSGTVSFYNKPLYVYIDRGGLLPGDYTGHIDVYAAAKPDFLWRISVAMAVDPIHGDYSGTLVVNRVNGKQIPAISTGLFLSVSTDQSSVAARIPAEKSLLFPHEVVLSGAMLDTSTSAFDMAGALVLEAGGALNPYPELAKTITRHVVFETDIVRSGNNMLGGYYRETVEGLLARSIEVEGQFELHKVSDYPNNDPDYDPTAGYITVFGQVKYGPARLPNVTGPNVTMTYTTPVGGRFCLVVPKRSYALRVQATKYFFEPEYMNQDISEGWP